MIVVSKFVQKTSFLSLYFPNATFQSLKILEIQFSKKNFIYFTFPSLVKEKREKGLLNYDSIVRKFSLTLISAMKKSILGFMVPFDNESLTWMLFHLEIF